MDMKSSAARRYAFLAHINLLELMRVEIIVLPLVYISARVYILHGPSWKSWMMSLIVISYIVTNGAAGLVLKQD